MKKRRIERIGAVVIVVLMIILVLVWAVFFQEHGETEQVPEESSEYEEPISETMETEESESETEKVAIDETGFIFVGESHMVVADAEYASKGSDIGDITYNENLFFVQTGLSGWMGTSQWLTSEGSEEGEEGAFAQIDKILAQHDLKKWYIIIQHGSSMSQYEAQWADYPVIYETYKNRYAQCELFVLSVPPVQEEEFLAQTGVVRSNQSIIDFNSYTKTLIGDTHYLDYYNWFCENGVYQDIIHFEGSTYKSLFNQIMGKLLE